MASDEIRASAVVNASAERVYNIIADYRDGHPRIVPPTHFKWMRVVSGGVGAGTTVDFEMRVMGASQVLRAVVTEPEPGRVLVESYPATGVVTTFMVEPRGPQVCEVAFVTALSGRSGVRSAVERWVSRRVLPGMYKEELQRLAELAEGRRVHEPVPVW